MLARLRGQPHSDDLDSYIGQKIRERRIYLGLTQRELAKSLGVTFQQVQKYENGRDRTAASRLYYIAQALGVSVVYFYEGFEQTDATAYRNFDAPLVEDVRLMTELRRVNPEAAKRIYQLTRACVNQSLDQPSTPSSN